MITLSEDLDTSDRSRIELIGLSTDAKPLRRLDNGQEIGHGSSLYTTDDGKLYLYGEENHKWTEQ